MDKYTFQRTFAQRSRLELNNGNRPNASRIGEFTGHRESIYALDAIHDGSGVLSAGGDGLVVSWAIEKNPEAAGTVVARVAGSIYAICMLPHQPVLLVGQNQSGIHRIPLDSGTPSSLALGASAIFSVIPTSDSAWAFAGLGNGELIRFDTKTLTIRNRIRVSDKSIRTLALHPEGHEIAVGGSDHCIRIFNIRDTAMPLVREWEAHGNSVFTVAYSPDGRMLLSAGRDAKVRRWISSEAYGSAGTTDAHLHAIHQIAFSPDGKHFLTCSMDKTIKVWASGPEPKLQRVLDRARHAGHGNSVNRICWINEDTFASAGDDRVISIWKFLPA